MSILIKFVLQNIKEKKMRTFLILFSISLSSALLFASLAISSTIEKGHEALLRNFFGSAEIEIYADKDSPSTFFYTNQAVSVEDQFTYLIGVVEGEAMYRYSLSENIFIKLNGYDLGDLEKFNPLILQETYNLYPFKGEKIILGREDAKRYNLLVGDRINLQINGQTYRFTVAAIAASHGLFYPTGQGGIAGIVPKDKLAAIYDVKARVSKIFAQTKAETTVSAAINLLADKYRRYVIEETITREEILERTRMITTPFMLMLILVVFISSFIIYTAFKVISLERLPVIGTFRSVGATIKMTNMLMLIESMVYGVVGGLLGWVLGLGILLSMAMIIDTGSSSITFNFVQLLMSFGLALLLSLISSLIPIIKISKIPIRNIVLNSIENKAENKRLKGILGITLLAVFYSIPWFVHESQAVLINTLCLVGMAIAIIMLVPVLTNFISVRTEKFIGFLFGNEGFIALKNLHNNKNISNNIALMIMGIAGILTINIISSSIGMGILNFYNNAQYNIEMTHPELNREIEGRLRAIRGVQSTEGVYIVNNVKILEKKNNIGVVYGVDGNNFFDYWSLPLIGSRSEMLDKLNAGRAILVTPRLKEKFSLAVGDQLTLEMVNGNKVYEVAGFVDAYFDNGNVGFVSERFFKRDMGLQYFSKLYIKTNKNFDKVNTEIKEKFNRENIWSETVAFLEDTTIRTNGQLFTLLKGFSVIAMLIGFIGIFNNYLVSLMSRRRSIAVLRSVGMSKKQVLKMLFLETTISGLIGGTIGIIGGWLFISITVFVLKAINLYLPIYYSLSLFIIAFLSGVVISVSASFIPALKFSKLNIVEAIKYE
ncbi:MAG: FtsX-like permease family protein [Halanaerobiales bacterium]|nr:FtsX-like permease family protein [Halanaerobiales bacterium]